MRLVTCPSRACPLIGADGYNILMTGIGGLGHHLACGHPRDGGAISIIGKSAFSTRSGSRRRAAASTRTCASARKARELFASRIGAGQADLVLAADMVVAHGKNGLPMMSPERTAVVADGQIMPTAEFVANNAVKYNTASMQARLKANARSVDECPAQAIATALLGDAIFANMVLTGFAWQKGLIPLDRGAIMRAIELNGASVDANKRAFDTGREAAVDPARIMAKVVPPPKLSQTLDELIEIRVRDLTAYQDAAYASRYRAFVGKVRAAERAVAPKQ